MEENMDSIKKPLILRLKRKGTEAKEYYTSQDNKRQKYNCTYHDSVNEIIFDSISNDENEQSTRLMKDIQNGKINEHNTANEIEMAHENVSNLEATMTDLSLTVHVSEKSMTHEVQNYSRQDFITANGNLFKESNIPFNYLIHLTNSIKTLHEMINSFEEYCTTVIKTIKKHRKTLRMQNKVRRYTRIISRRPQLIYSEESSDEMQQYEKTRKNHEEITRVPDNEFDDVMEQQNEEKEGQQTPKELSRERESQTTQEKESDEEVIEAQELIQEKQNSNITDNDQNSDEHVPQHDTQAEFQRGSRPQSPFKQNCNKEKDLATKSVNEDLSLEPEIKLEFMTISENEQDQMYEEDFEQDLIILPQNNPLYSSNKQELENTQTMSEELPSEALSSQHTPINHPRSKINMDLLKDKPPKGKKGKNRNSRMDFDSKWTLRETAENPLAFELIPNSGVYINKPYLEKCLTLAKETRELARSLFRGIFNDDALMRCSMTGSTRGNRVYTSYVAPALDRNALRILWKFIDQEQHRRKSVLAWQVFPRRNVMKSLRNFMQRYRKDIYSFKTGRK